MAWNVGFTSWLSPRATRFVNFCQSRWGCNPAGFSGAHPSESDQLGPCSVLATQDNEQFTEALSGCLAEAKSLGLRHSQARYCTQIFTVRSPVVYGLTASCVDEVHIWPRKLPVHDRVLHVYKARQAADGFRAGSACSPCLQLYPQPFLRFSLQNVFGFPTRFRCCPHGCGSRSERRPFRGEPPSPDDMEVHHRWWMYRS